MIQRTESCGGIRFSSGLVLELRLSDSKLLTVISISPLRSENFSNIDINLFWESIKVQIWLYVHTMKYVASHARWRVVDSKGEWVLGRDRGWTVWGDSCKEWGGGLTEWGDGWFSNELLWRPIFVWRKPEAVEEWWRVGPSTVKSLWWHSPLKARSCFAY